MDAPEITPFSKELLLCKNESNKKENGIIINLYSFLPRSYVNGPGVRAVMWMQGCSLNCPGCCNPDMHPFDGGEKIRVDDLFKRIVDLEDSIEGITVSGGEPLQQPEAIAALLRKVRLETNFSIIVLTGYTWGEVQEIKKIDDILSNIDVLISGRYDRSCHLAQCLLGSSNKTIHFLTSRYTEEDFKTISSAEVIITLGGEIITSGIEPIRMAGS